MSWLSRKKEEPVVEVEEEVSTQESEATTSSNCAWCGDPPNEFGSHGICEFHAEQMEGQLAWRKLQRTPSYAERFKDGREAWDE